MIGTLIKLFMGSIMIKSGTDKISSYIIETEQDKKECERWMKEIGVSSLYSKFKAIEDPNIIKDAPSIFIQLKIERIKECQRQYELNR